MSFSCLNPALKQVRCFTTPARLPSPICTAILVRPPSPLPWPWQPRGPPLPSRTGTRTIFYTINQSISFSCLKPPWPPCRLDCRCPSRINPLSWSLEVSALRFLASSPGHTRLPSGLRVAGSCCLDLVLLVSSAGSWLCTQGLAHVSSDRAPAL